MSRPEEKTASPQEQQPLLLSVRDVHKSFRNGDTTSHVLRGVSFDVFAGELLCITGESGCGKTTVLNILGGLLDFDSGSVRYQGRELRGLGKREQTEYRRRNVGFVFQSYYLMPNLDAVSNVRLIAELVSDPMDAYDALRLVGMEDRADRYPGKLSGGQQQRVAIARAMVKRPRLLLADEPTAALDYETSVGVLQAFEAVVRSGTTLVMVTHNEEITKMADRVIRIRDGRTDEIGRNAAPVRAESLKW